MLLFDFFNKIHNILESMLVQFSHEFYHLFEIYNCLSFIIYGFMDFKFDLYIDFLMEGHLSTRSRILCSSKEVSNSTN
jgi:hypothetical protein